MRTHSILIADDDALTSYALKDHLEQLGYHVTVAENGGQAREALGAPEKVDLMILDYRLPDGQGTELLLALGRESMPHKPRVIISSGLLDAGGASWDALRPRLPENARRLIAACVNKPYTFDSMDAVVNLILSAEERREAHPNEILSGDYEALPPAPAPREIPRVS